MLLVDNLLSLILSSLLDLFLFFFDLFFHLVQLRRVVDLDDFFNLNHLFVAQRFPVPVHHLRQLLLQFIYFILEVANKRVLRVLVDVRLILDVLGPVRISERADRFIVVVVSRSNVGDHHGFGIAAQRILEQSGQFRVSVGYVCGVGVHQLRYHIAESGQAEVDVDSFLQPVPLRVRLALPL